MRRERKEEKRGFFQLNLFYRKKKGELLGIKSHSSFPLHFSEKEKKLN